MIFSCVGPLYFFRLRVLGSPLTRLAIPASDVGAVDNPKPFFGASQLPLPATPYFLFQEIVDAPLLLIRNVFRRRRTSGSRIVAILQTARVFAILFGRLLSRVVTVFCSGSAG